MGKLFKSLLFWNQSANYWSPRSWWISDSRFRQTTIYRCKDLHVIVNDFKMYKDKEAKKNVKDIFLSMCDVKVSLTLLHWIWYCFDDCFTYFVKWLNWPHKFDSWIGSEDIEDKLIWTCMLKWLQTCHDKGNSKSCPVCRTHCGELYILVYELLLHHG
jgi:hypothetical protein